MLNVCVPFSLTTFQTFPVGVGVDQGARIKSGRAVFREAVAGKGDGRVSVEDAKTVLEKTADANKVA